MSAPNFYQANASKVFMVRCDDDYVYDDTKCNIRCELKRKGWYPSDGYDGERSYPGCIIAEKSEEVSIGSFCIDIYVRSIIRAGYFCDANLDWDIEIDGTSYDMEYVDEYLAKEFLEDSYWYGDNPGFCKMQYKNLYRKISEAISVLTEELESVYESYSEQLVRIAVFSNGEAIYGPANNHVCQIKAAM